MTNATKKGFQVTKSISVFLDGHKVQQADCKVVLLKTEHFYDGRGVPLDFFGFCVEDGSGAGMSRNTDSATLVNEAKTAGESGTFCPVAILIPPAILDKVQTVFNLPVTANPTHQIKRRKGATDQDSSRNNGVREKEYCLSENIGEKPRESLSDTHTNLVPAVV